LKYKKLTFQNPQCQPLFNPGLPAEKRAALAAFDAAAANYQNVALESLDNVADVLRALKNDAQRLTAFSRRCCRPKFPHIEEAPGRAVRGQLCPGAHRPNAGATDIPKST
jgi:hypothetical protein